MVLDRDLARAGSLEAAGATLVRADLRDNDRLMAMFAGADAVIHAAGSYRVGLTAAERPAMEASNVHAAAAVLEAAGRSRVAHVVHVSTDGIFGNTRGHAVDERYRRPTPRRP